MTNFIHYSKPDTKAGELMKKEMPLIKYSCGSNGSLTPKVESRDGKTFITVSGGGGDGSMKCTTQSGEEFGAVLVQSRFQRHSPLQSIDYVNNHKRCDDDLRLAERLSTASKYIGIALSFFAAWFVVLHLTFKALEVM